MIRLAKGLTHVAAPLYRLHGPVLKPRVNGISDFPPVALAENLLLTLQSTLPWWAAISSSAVVLRATFSLPVAVWQARMRARMIRLAPHMRSLAAVVRASVVRTGKYSSEEEINAAAIAEYAKAAKKMYREHNIRPIFSMIVGPLVQFPVFATVFWALRDLSGVTAGSVAHADMATGGFWLFSNLTQPDETWLLPALCSAIYLLNTELNVHYGRIQAVSAGMEPGFLSRAANGIMRLASLAMFPIGCSMPMGFEIYWITSGLWSVLQTFALNQPSVRRLVGSSTPAVPPASHMPPPPPQGPPKTYAQRPQPQQQQQQQGAVIEAPASDNSTPQQKQS